MIHPHSPVFEAKLLEGLIKANAAELVSVSVQPYNEDTGPEGGTDWFGKATAIAAKADWFGRRQLSPPKRMWMRRASANLLDVEYLKNTILKMYRTGEAGSLLPVFSTILSFSPQELAACKSGLEAIKLVPLPQAAAAVDGVFSSLNSWTSWATGSSNTPLNPTT
eukprot:gene14944-20999_t